MHMKQININTNIQNIKVQRKYIKNVPKPIIATLSAEKTELEKTEPEKACKLNNYDSSIRKHNHHHKIFAIIRPYFFKTKYNIDIIKACQQFYYYFITAEIWLGMKLNIAQQKIEHYYDDYQYEEEVEPKTISKKDKNIRIHSLKKNYTTNNNNMNNVVTNNSFGLNNNSTSIGVNNKGSNRSIIIGGNLIKSNNLKRQPSNVKQKRKAIQELQVTNNQQLMRNTQIGFKRLLVPKHSLYRKNGHKNTTSIDIDDQQIPLQLSDILLSKDCNVDEEYIIKSKDIWSVNMQRAQNLIKLIKKWNDFHHRIIVQLKKSHKSIHTYLASLQQVNTQFISGYAHKFTAEQQPYLKILQSIKSADKNLLIDNQLNKVSRLFLSNHYKMLAISAQIQVFNAVLCNSNEKLINNCYNKIKTSFGKEQIDSVQFVEMFAAVQDIVQSCLFEHKQKFRNLLDIVGYNLLSIFSIMLEHHETTKIIKISHENKYLSLKNKSEAISTSISTITFSDLVQAPDFFEILLQTLISICNKLLKFHSVQLCSHETTNNQNSNISANNSTSNQLMISMVVSRIKNTKAIFQNLWNVAKYFNKLLKQVSSKSKDATAKQDKQSDKKMLWIIQFFQEYYSSNSRQLFSIGIKNANKIDKDMLEFKENIGKLKQKMQNQ